MINKVELLSIKWLNPEYPNECRMTVEVTWTTGSLWWKNTHKREMTYRGWRDGWHDEVTADEVKPHGALAKELERHWRLERWAREDELRDKDKNVVERLAEE